MDIGLVVGSERQITHGIEGFRIEGADGPAGVVDSIRRGPSGNWLVVRVSSWQGERTRLSTTRTGCSVTWRVDSSTSISAPANRVWPTRSHSRAG